MEDIIEVFENFEDEPNRLQEMTNNVDGSFSLTELFTSKFMQQYTQFESIEELLSSGGFEVNSEEDYEAIPDEDIDAHVVKTTKLVLGKKKRTSLFEMPSSRMTDLISKVGWLEQSLIP